VLVLAAPEFCDHPDPLRELRAAFPTSIIAGCSTAGEIHGTELKDRSLSVAVVRFAETRIRFATTPIRDVKDSRAAGDALARQLEAPGLRAVLVFSDGLKVNGSSLVQGINSVLSDRVVVTGGLAGDGGRFKRTWVLKDGAPAEGFVSAVGLYGDRVIIRHGSKGGWDPFGPERIITRAEGNVLYDLDGAPALPLYKKYLGSRATELPASALLFPLSLRSSSSDEKRLVRTVLSTNDADGSMVFAGDVPQGHLAQFMCANNERLVDGAAEAAFMAGSVPAGPDCPPGLCLAISCVGRRLVLRDRTEDELESVLTVLPPGTRQIGFYSYGELSPYASGKCDLHNQTMTITTISEF
jgi:hypothetical protein